MMTRLHRLARRLRVNTSGLALIEFAYGLPIVLGVGLMGVEVTNLAVTRMRISQIALNVGDNASRVGESTQGSLKQVLESDILDVFEGARIAGEPIELRQRGRIILSSLQQNATGGQWIAWQRCFGQRTSYTPQYGTAGSGRTNNSFLGMGPANARVTALPSNAVMFVELYYEYKPVIGIFATVAGWMGFNLANQVLTYRSAFVVRDFRKLGVSTGTTDVGLYPNVPALTPATC